MPESNMKSEYPEWFKYIRVQEVHTLGGCVKQPAQYLISFGRQYHCKAEESPKRQEQRLERIKEWLWMWIQKDNANAPLHGNRNAGDAV